MTSEKDLYQVLPHRTPKRNYQLGKWQQAARNKYLKNNSFIQLYPPSPH
jgi:hypothetical protein